VALDDLAGTDAQEAAHEATMRLMDRIHALEATL